MTIKYASIFHTKALQNLPKWDFWFENKPSGNPALDPNFRIQEFSILPTYLPTYVRGVSSVKVNTCMYLGRYEGSSHFSM
jgi:hypothetical protein